MLNSILTHKKTVAIVAFAGATVTGTEAAPQHGRDVGRLQDAFMRLVAGFFNKSTPGSYDQFVSHFCELHSRMQKLLAKPEALNSDYTRNAAEYNSAFGVNSYEEFATTITHITNVFGKLCHELQTRKGEPAVQLAKLFGEFVQNMPATVQQRLAGSGASPAKYIAAIQHRKKQ